MEMDNDAFSKEETLLSELERRNIRAFMRLYKNYGDDLLIYAYSQLNDRGLAVQTVDEFFEDLWAAVRFTEIKPPIYRYLMEQMRGICEKKT
jgi:DNA-directed RNA polymerase specialized sigma24 family protein